MSLSYPSTCTLIVQDLESVTVKSSLSTPDTTNILHIITSSIQSQDTTQQPEILSSTPQSIQNSTDFDIVLTSQSSNLSSTAPSLLPSTPSQDSASILIPFAFFVVLILVSVFVLIQCSHFLVYMARQAFKDRNSGLTFRNLAQLMAQFNCSFYRTKTGRFYQVDGIY